MLWMLQHTTSNINNNLPLIRYANFVIICSKTVSLYYNKNYFYSENGILVAGIRIFFNFKLQKYRGKSFFSFNIRTQDLGISF